MIAATSGGGGCRCGVVVRALCVWSVLIARLATAHAEPRGDVALVWRAPGSCPVLAEVQARIERRLGMPIDRAVHGIEVEITASGDGRFVARIDLRSVTMANEVRVLTSAGCDELSDAVAVVIARIAAENRPPVAEAPRERPRPVLAVRPPEVRGWGGGMRALGVSGIGALPGVGVGGELAAHVRIDSMFLEVGATRWLRGHGMAPPGSSGTVDVGLDVIALRIGWRPEHVPVRGWIAGELGSVAGDTTQLGHHGVGRWEGIGGGFGVAWPMSTHTRLVGLIEAVVPLDRAQFLVEDGVELYRPDPVSVRSGLGLEVGWP